MPHALEHFANSYRHADPVFAKRSRQLQRSLLRCRLAAKKAAVAGEPGRDLYSALRDFLKDHKSFVQAYKTRTGEVFFPEAEQMLADLAQMERIKKLIPDALPGNRPEAMVSIVQELLS